LGALVYEALLLAALLLVAGFALLPWISPGLSTSGRELILPTLLLRFALLCVLFAGAGGYYVWSWTGGRRTLPMKTWRIRILTVAGRNVRPLAALIRYLAGWIGPAAALIVYAAIRPLSLAAYAIVLVFLNYLWAIVDRDRQFLHDRIAGTVLQTTAG